MASAHLMISTAALLLVVTALICPCCGRYQPNWESLDQRVAPTWYDEGKLGVFVHWGVYSVPSFGSESTLGEWFWWWWKGNPKKEYVDFMKKNYPPNFQYQDFAPQFKGEFFDPDHWADVIQASGAKYFIITSKHHEGWTNWKSNVSWNWNSVDNGPHRDIVADISQSIRKRTNVRFCLYHSLFEWFNPTYLQDKANGFQTQNYVKDILMPELYDMVLRYKPEYIWSDGDWDASYEYWNSPEFIAWLYNDSPVKDVILVNDRWGKGTNCKHGDVKTCGIDRFQPGKVVDFKFENAMTIDRHSWGFRRNAPYGDILSITQLIAIFVETVSFGGNMVMNVGPTADGRIVPIFEERLRQMGTWLAVNGEAIYSSKIWRIQNDTMTPYLWYTAKEKAVYAITLEWPKNGFLKLSDPVITKQTTVSMLGLHHPVEWQPLHGNKGLAVNFRSIETALIPCEWGWVIKLTNVE